MGELIPAGRGSAVPPAQRFSSVTRMRVRHRQDENARPPSPAPVIGSEATFVGNLEAHAIHLVFARMPGLYHLLKYTRLQGSEVVFVFSEGPYDPGAVVACVKEFAARTSARLRMLMEFRLPDDKPKKALEGPVRASRQQQPHQQKEKPGQTEGSPARTIRTSLANGPRSATLTGSEVLTRPGKPAHVPVENPPLEQLVQAALERARSRTQFTLFGRLRAAVLDPKSKGKPRTDASHTRWQQLWKWLRESQRHREICHRAAEEMVPQQCLCPSCGRTVVQRNRPCSNCERKRSLCELLAQVVGGPEAELQSAGLKV